METVSLRDYMAEVVRRLEAEDRHQQEIAQVRWESDREAVVQARETMKERLEAANGLLHLIRQQTGDTMPRVEIDARFASLRAQANWLIGLLVAIGIAAVAYIVRTP